MYGKYMALNAPCPAKKWPPAMNICRVLTGPGKLYVVPECRNRRIGRSLIAQVKKKFDPLNVYALSDEDAYYEKLGFTRVGSVFEVSTQADKTGL